MWAASRGDILSGLPGLKGETWGTRHPALYKKRNEIARLFPRLKGLRRIFSSFEKLDALFLGFLNFALIIEALRLV